MFHLAKTSSSITYEVFRFFLVLYHFETMCREEKLEQSSLRSLVDLNLLGIPPRLSVPSDQFPANYYLARSIEYDHLCDITLSLYDLHCRA